MCRVLLNITCHYALRHCEQERSNLGFSGLISALSATKQHWKEWVASLLLAMTRETVTIIFLLLPTSTFALPEDREQPFNIVADSSIFNYKTGIDTYTGNVKVDQGTSHLTADRLVTQKNKQHKMTAAIATGTKKFAEYTTVPKIGDPVLNAKARIIKFYPPTSIIILEQDVVITQKENSFHGPLIIYNMKDQVVTAPASQNGRATIVIEPEQLK